MESDYDRYRKVNIDKEIEAWCCSDEERQQFEKEWEGDFWLWWEEVRAFADQYRLSTRYVEEEFILDGELIPVHLTFPDDE